MIKEDKRLVTIFLIALALRMILFIAVGFWQEEVYEKRIGHIDSTVYKKLALNLAKNGVFSRSESPPYQPEIFMTPLYPSFLASIYIISGYKPYIAVLLQIFIGSATCLLIYKLGKILFDERTALLAGLFTAFEYSGILYSNILITETLFNFLFAVHVIFLMKFLKSDRIKWLAYSAVFLGISSLTRAASVYFFMFLVVIFGVHFRKNLKKGIMKYSAFTLIFLAVLSPWVARSYRVSGKFMVSSAQNKVLDWSFDELREIFKERNATFQDVDSVQDTNLRKTNQGKLSKKRIFNTFKRYIYRTLRFLLIPSSSSYFKLLDLPHKEMKIEELGGTPWESIKLTIQKKSKQERFVFVLCVSFLLFLYFTMSVGVYRAIKKNKKETLLLIIIIIIYFMIPALSISWTQRYRVPIMPYVILLSSYGMVYVQKVFKKTKSPKRAKSDFYPPQNL